MKKERAGWLMLLAGLATGPFSPFVSAAFFIAGAVLIIQSTMGGRD